MTTAAAPPDLKRYRSATTLTMRATPTELPAGVCGQVEGVALVYNVVDSWGTTFAKGCLERTARERVARGRVRLFIDHGDVPVTGMYDTHLHIGVVREVWDDVTADGKPCAKFRADIFDTESGRAAHEYLRAIAATASETGVSVGLMGELKTTRAMIDGVPCEQFGEVALREISVTAVSSVPGTKVTAVRAEIDVPAVTDADASIDYFALLDGIVAHLGASVVRAHLSPILSGQHIADSNAEQSAPLHSDSNDANGGSQGVSRVGSEPTTPNADMDERLAFVRAQFSRLSQ